MLALAFATGARGELAIDHFDYGPIDLGTMGLNGGSGWGGAWAGANPGLTYSPDAQITWTQSGYSNQGNDPASGGLRLGVGGSLRPLPVQATGVVWVSVLTWPTHVFNRDFALRTNDTIWDVQVGHSGPAYVEFRDGINWGSGSLGSEPHLLLVKYEIDYNGSGHDRVSIWADAGTLTAGEAGLGEPRALREGSNALSGISNFGVGVDNQNRLDALRVSHGPISSDAKLCEVLSGVPATEADVGSGASTVLLLCGPEHVGGLEVTLDASQEGTVTASYDSLTPQEFNDCMVNGTCPPSDFRVPGSDVQLWEVDFTGALGGSAVLVFRYDDALLPVGSDELDLRIYHFTPNAQGIKRWQLAGGTGGTVDPVANTITVSTSVFSPFAVGIEPECSDGEDNDGDLAVDYPDDPGCRAADDPSEVPDCSDGINDDADGLVDFPADPGCASASDESEHNADPDRVCDDGLDNDGDGLADHRLDPGCRDPLWLQENPKCDDGADNDGDGGTDWDGGPAGGTPDPQCVNAPWRNKEKSGGCGLGGELVLLLLVVRASVGLRKRSS
jgi:hypothetical protein